MQIANAKLRDYFQSELTALRTGAVDFGNQYPVLAESLGLNIRGATDPQVELLMQSFAFLTGRLQFQIEQDKAAPPNALLAFLYPHLEAPTPSMLVAQLAVKPDSASFVKEQVLKRGRYVSASAENNLGLKIECRFRTCYETPLLPLSATEIDLSSTADYPSLKSSEIGQLASKSVLRVRLHTDGESKLPTKGGGPLRLRFYINSAEQDALVLYEMLALYLSAIVIQVPDTNQSIALCSDIALRWLGMEDSEAMLQANPQTQPGYRLLQEYFSFPEKFMFFEVSLVDNINFSGVQDFFDLLFVLDTPFDAKRSFDSKSLLLNCVPLVNLFSQRLDPISVNHTEYEYHLKGDLKNHRYCEIIAIEELESITANGSPRPIAPYFALDDFRRLEQQDYFYVARREQSQVDNIAGTEIFISFLDQQYDLTQLTDEVIGGRALCTNRRLPEQLKNGSPMYLEGSGPITGITVLSKPTPHHTPAQIGRRPLALVSQLSLNHLSLANKPEALSALKDILRLHLGSNPRNGSKQIDAISSLENRSIVRHLSQDGWRGFVRGSEIKLVMDQNQFKNVNASPVLFCSVLRNFFRLYASVNNIVELNLETQQIKGTQKQWAPLAGAKIVL
ncbi:type VI secretion system baseplate subunit TssF [Undibacterium sp. Xuan67W]|uniref:type VI secretion system baseplate subunit TssF n=1 Tax=Undibacterium sp. Xuan67W TaxID=3413057 RepID=UPI003BEFAB3B